MHRVRIGGRFGTERAHRSGLPAVPLSNLRQAVQRAECWRFEPDAVSQQRHRSRGIWRLRYKLALRDLPEMFLIRGIVFSHEAVRDWEAKLTPALAEGLRRRRRGKAGRSWYVDETYIKVHGQWRYLYRAIDRSGALVDVMFSEHRDMTAAKAFFESAKMVTGITPDRVTTDGHDSYPRAIRTTLGEGVRHRDNCRSLDGVDGPRSRHRSALKWLLLNTTHEGSRPP